MIFFDSSPRLRRAPPRWCARSSDLVDAGEWYRALKSARQLIAREQEILNDFADAAHIRGRRSRGIRRAPRPGRSSRRRASFMRSRSGSLERRRAALRRNWRLWTIFQASLLDPDCDLPERMRSNLLGLTNFIDRHTAELLGDGDRREDRRAGEHQPPDRRGLARRPAGCRDRRPGAGPRRLARPDRLTPP